MRGLFAISFNVPRSNPSGQLNKQVLIGIIAGQLKTLRIGAKDFLADQVLSNGRL